MTKAIIFDCFGVILTDALSQMCAVLGRTDPQAVKEVKAVIRAANQGTIEVQQSRQTVSKLFGISVEEYITQVRSGEVRNEELLQYLLKLRGPYKTALLSNIGKGSLQIRFTPEELDRYFDVVVASAEIGYAKPEPQAYEITAEQLGVRCDACVFIDDRDEFCEAARAVGMKAIVYTEFEQFKRDLALVLSNS